MSLEEFEPNKYRITVGHDDSDDGIHIYVVDDEFPSFSLTAEGVFQGDGQSEPEAVTYTTTDFTAIEDDVSDLQAVSNPDPSAKPNGTYLVLATITGGVAVNTYVDSADYENA